MKSRLRFDRSRWARRTGGALLLVAGLLPQATALAGQVPDPAPRWTLEAALQQALNHNPDARVAQHRIAAAQAGLAQANAAFWPRLQFGSSYAVSDNPVRVFGSALNQRTLSLNNMPFDFNDVPDADNLNVNGVLTVPIYAGGQNAAGRRAAQAQSAAARHLAEATRNLLAFEVTRAFYTVQKTREFVRATEAAVTAYESNLAIAKKRHATGTALKHEVLDVEVRLAQAREDLVRARNAQALSLRVLRNLVGIENQPFDVTETAPELVIPEAERAPFGRPELLAASRQSQAAEAALRQAKGAQLPRLDAFGRYDYDRGWELEGYGHSYTAGIMLQWDLWDADFRRAKIREAQAQLDASREEIRKARLAVDLETEQARLSLDEATERLVVTDKAVEQAAESAELTRLRFEQGLALATQVIDAETALVASRVRRAEAEADRRIAVAALRKALGLPPLEPTSSPP